MPRNREREQPAAVDRTPWRETAIAQDELTRLGFSPTYQSESVAAGAADADIAEGEAVAWWHALKVYFASDAAFDQEVFGDEPDPAMTISERTNRTMAKGLQAIASARGWVL